MPSLMATLGLDPAPFKAGLDNAVESARSAGGRIMSSLGNDISKSTVVNPRAPKSMGRDYTDWWSQSLLDRDVEAASRSNQARRLMRQRHADQERADATAAQERLDGEIEAASRRNMARRLMRERAEKRAAREAEAQESSMFNRTGMAAVEYMGAAAGALGAGLSLEAIEEGISSSIEYVTHIKDLSEQFNVSTDTIQKWDKAASRIGMTAEDVGKSLMQLRKHREEAIKTGSDAHFAPMGIDINTLKNTALTTEDIWFKMGDIAASHKLSESEQAAAMDIMGKSGSKILNVMRELRDMGPMRLIAQEDIEKLDQAQKKIDEAKRQLKVATAEGIVGASKPGSWAMAVMGALGEVGPKMFTSKMSLKEGLAEVQSIVNETLNGKPDKDKGPNAYKAIQASDPAARAKELKELEQSRNELAEKIYQNSLKSMTVDEKRAELKKQIAEHEKKAIEYEFGEGDETKANREKIKAEEAKGQLAELDRSSARGPKGFHYRAPEVNSLQRIGAYVSPELAGLADSTKQSLGHLQAIRTHLENLDKNARDTKF